MAKLRVRVFMLCFQFRVRVSFSHFIKLREILKQILGGIRGNYGRIKLSQIEAKGLNFYVMLTI